MSAVEGVRVEPIVRRTSGLLGAEVDAPAASEAFGLRVEGWTLGRDGAPAAIRAVVPGRILASATPALPSPDVAERFPEAPGADRCRWRLMLNTLDLPLRFGVRLRADFADGRRVMVAEIGGRRRPIQPRYAPRLSPLLVTSLARCGTTLLMRLLGEHPGVVAYRHYPYEVRGGKYWLHLLRVLSAPADPGKRVGKPNEFHEEPLAAGANPFYSPTFAAYPAVDAWSGSDYVDRLAAFCQESIDGWYGRVAASQGQPEAVYFAEKSYPDEFPPLFQEIYPQTREIVLVRDFRDMLASMVAYNRRKELPDFGRARVGSDAEWLKALGGGVDRLLASWQERQETARLVRYEELIADPGPILAELFGYLDLDASPATVAGVLARAAAETPELRRHGTSESSGASVGRWRRDLEPELRDAADGAFAAALRGFGYA